MTKTHCLSLRPLAFAIALLAGGSMIAGCTPAGETPAAHSSADRTEGHSQSSAGLPPGHAAAGQKLAESTCVACHGPGGNAPIDPTYPRLGGQYHDYIAHSLQMYRAGDRQNALMTAQAKNLTDQQISDVAAYFSTQPTHLRDMSGLE